MKIAIVGSRSFDSYDEIESHLEQYKGQATLVISGGAKGVDTFGERWAIKNSIPTLIFKPDWDKHGKSAGYLRNKDIVANADLVIAFWDGTSKGTKHSIDIAKTSGKELRIIYKIPL